VLCPQRDEGLAREIINRVQKLRKKTHLLPTDPVQIMFVVTHSTPETPLAEVVTSHGDYIAKALDQPFAPVDPALAPIAEESFKVNIPECRSVRCSALPPLSPLTLLTCLLQIGDAEIKLAIATRQQ
jgi:hypothetical protein